MWKWPVRGIESGRQPEKRGSKPLSGRQDKEGVQAAPLLCDFTTFSVCLQGLGVTRLQSCCSLGLCGADRRGASERSGLGGESVRRHAGYSEGEKGGTGGGGDFLSHKSKGTHTCREKPRPAGSFI